MFLNGFNKLFILLLYLDFFLKKWFCYFGFFWKNLTEIQVLTKKSAGLVFSFLVFRLSNGQIINFLIIYLNSVTFKHWIFFLKGACPQFGLIANKYMIQELSFRNNFTSSCQWRSPWKLCSNCVVSLLDTLCSWLKLFLKDQSRLPRIL